MVPQLKGSYTTAWDSTSRGSAITPLFAAGYDSLMTREIRPTDIFTPGDFPSHTYVERSAAQLEEHVRNGLATRGQILSVSGPPKSGKTVLIERVIGFDNLVTVTGAGLYSSDHLWDRVLDWMGSPSGVGLESERSVGGTVSGKVGGEAGIPFVAKGKAEASAAVDVTRLRRSTEEHGRRGMVQVIEEIADSEFVLLIDDFHYMDRAVQIEVAKQIKEAARQGVKICTASVPHRSDDVVRSNPELRGRVLAIDVGFWNIEELKEIGHIGFPILGATVEEELMSRLAKEASGSPQLMQALCLDLCFELLAQRGSLAGRQVHANTVPPTSVLSRTSARTDYRSLVRKLHTGPKSRGTERKEYPFSDGTKGDVYRCVLLAIASDPPRLRFTYEDLMSRIVRVSPNDQPRPQSVYQTCAQMAAICEATSPGERIFEWDDDQTQVDIPDPYFLFYLRWSNALSDLGSTE
jgi:hypothetical protein